MSSTGWTRTTLDDCTSRSGSFETRAPTSDCSPPSRRPSPTRSATHRSVNSRGVFTLKGRPQRPRTSSPARLHVVGCRRPPRSVWRCSTTTCSDPSVGSPSETTRRSRRGTPTEPAATIRPRRFPTSWSPTFAGSSNRSGRGGSLVVGEQQPRQCAGGRVVDLAHLGAGHLVDEQHGLGHLVVGDQRAGVSARLDRRDVVTVAAARTMSVTVPPSDTPSETLTAP